MSNSTSTDGWRAWKLLQSILSLGYIRCPISEWINPGICKAPHSLNNLAILPTTVPVTQGGSRIMLGTQSCDLVHGMSLPHQPTDRLLPLKRCRSGILNVGIRDRLP